MPGEHGTRSGYERHRKEESAPCDPCREANRIYQRQRWASSPEVRKRKHEAKLRYGRVSAAVLRRFKAEFPEEYYGIWAEEAERLT